MAILFAIADVDGWTREIADIIARTLMLEGDTVDIRNVAKVQNIDGYDAAIIGSSMYFGKWQPEAVRFLRTFTRKLVTIPVWTFTTGPITDVPQFQPLDLHQNTRLAGSREHRIFSHITTPSLSHRLLARAAHIKLSDWREWEDLRAWAESITHALRHLQGRPTTGPISAGHCGVTESGKPVQAAHS